MALTLIGVGASAAPSFAPRVFGDRPTAIQMDELGRALFNDTRLSGSGKMSCASCHDPKSAFGPGAGQPSPFADGNPAHAGTRAIPSLRYLQFTQRFNEHYVDGDENELDGVDGGPSGGLTWDGRVDTPHEQALIPLFAAHEMANANPKALAEQLRGSSNAAAFRRAFSEPGKDVFDDPAQVVGWIGAALEVYQQNAKDFYPFNSKYDRVQRGKARLNPAETRGLALFTNEDKGNCAGCHTATLRNNSSFPLFSDGGHISLGVPRRAGLPVPQTEADYDLGLCRSGRAGLSDDPAHCGRFKSPSLRNVAVRPSFFHNGAIHSLHDVVAFYATRDTDPGRWYGHDAQGKPKPYDDLPVAYQPYLEMGAPFQPLPGNKPRLNEREIRDIVAFLGTLSDQDVAELNPAAQPAVRRKR